VRDVHVEKILGACRGFEDISEFARVVTHDEIQANDSNLSISLYVEDSRRREAVTDKSDLGTSVTDWRHGAEEARSAVAQLLDIFRSEVAHVE
jgi:type I restriction-modification system DNA methylase subunit